MLLHLSPAEVKRWQEAVRRQAEMADDAPHSASGGQGGVDSEAEGSYLGGWASWAFGEGEKTAPNA